jgi:hypothetical protein
MPRLIKLVVFAVLAGGWAMTAHAQGTPPGVDPRADQLLREMSDFLAQAPEFGYEAAEEYDEVPDSGPRYQVGNVRHVVVRRPNRAVSDASGDAFNSRVWYDGKSLAVLDEAHNAYTLLDVPDTLDAAVDHVADEYGIVVPLSDLLYSSFYAAVIDNVVEGVYLGVHTVGDVSTHHLAFAGHLVDWQVWIDVGEKPLPRKLTITYRAEPGEPRFSATFTHWNLAPDVSEELFTFAPPAGAQRMEPLALRARLRARAEGEPQSEEEKP